LKLTRDTGERGKTMFSPIRPGDRNVLLGLLRVLEERASVEFVNVDVADDASEGLPYIAFDIERFSD
jgi:hypothetical protein